MPLIDDLLFEVERRSILFHKDTSMPDGTQLGYDNDPNLAVPSNSDGEFLLYHSPSGTRYIQKNTSPFTIWKKVSDNAGGLWLEESGAGGSLLQKIETFIIDSVIISNGYLQLSENIESDNNHLINMNGLLLFEGSGEDFTIDASTNRIVFTNTQLSLLTISDKIQVTYKYK